MERFCNMATVGISVTQNNKGIGQSISSPRTADIYQNFIKLNANIPSRTKALKTVS